MKHIQNKFFKLAIFKIGNIIRILYKKKCNEPKEIIVPILTSTGIPSNVMIKIFGTYILFGFLMFLIVKDIRTPRSAPSANKYNEKRVLPLYLHCPFQLGQYIILRQKNKNNSSLIHINPGEIGLIVEKLNGVDHALVDFSIDIPIRFKKLDTTNLVKNVYLEGVLIIEITETK